MSIGFVGRVSKSITSVEPFHLVRFRPENFSIVYHWQSISQCIVRFDPVVADPWSSPENTKLEFSHGEFQHHVRGQQTLFGESLQHVELNVEQTLQPVNGKITVQGITKPFVIKPPFTSIEISYNKRDAIVKINDAKDAYLLRVFHERSCVYDELEGVDRTFDEKFLDYLFDKMTEPINLQIKIYREKDVLEHKREYFEEHFEEYYEHIDEGDLKSILCDYDEDIREYISQDSDWDLTDVLSEFDIELSDFDYDENVEGFFDFFWLNQFYEQEFSLNPPDLEDYEIRYEANLRFDEETGYYIEIGCYGLPQKLNLINPEITIQSKQHPEQKLPFKNKFSIGNTSVNIFTIPVKFNQISDQDYDLEFVDQSIGLNYSTTISNHQYLEVECVETLEHISDDEIHFISLDTGSEFEGQIELFVLDQDKQKQIIHEENLNPKDIHDFSISINELRSIKNSELVIDEIFQYTECEELDMAIKVIPKGDERYGCIEKSVTIRRYPNPIIEAIEMSLNPALTPKIRVLKPYFKGLNFQLQFGPSKGSISNSQISGHWLELMPDLEKYRSLINTENNKWILYSLDPSNEFNQVEIASGEIEINKVDINNPGKLEIYVLGEEEKVLIKDSGVKLISKWPEQIDVTVCLKSRHSDSKIPLHTGQFSELLNLNAILNDNLDLYDQNFNSLKQKQYDIEISVTNQESWLIKLDYKSKINEWELIDSCADWAKKEWDGSIESFRKNDELNFLLVLRLFDGIKENKLDKSISRLRNGRGDAWKIRTEFLDMLKKLDLLNAERNQRIKLQYGRDIKEYLINLYNQIHNYLPQQHLKIFYETSYHIKHHKYQINLLEYIENLTFKDSKLRVLSKLNTNTYKLQNSSMSPTEYIDYLQLLIRNTPTSPSHYNYKNKDQLNLMNLEIRRIRSELTLDSSKSSKNSQAKTYEDIDQTSEINQPTPSQSSSTHTPVKPKSNPIPRKSLPTNVPKRDKKSKRGTPPPTRGGRKSKRNKLISKSSDSGKEEKVPRDVITQFKGFEKQYKNAPRDGKRKVIRNAERLIRQFPSLADKKWW